MIYLKTLLKVIDNSGAQMVECIKVLRKNPKNYAEIGDKIVCVVQKAKSVTSPFASTSANKVKRGDIVRAVIVRTKKELRRPDGSTIRFDDNACVLLNKNDQPIGNRIMGVVAKELRGKDFGKVLALAPKAV